jgi:hypothetical protein
VGSVAMITRHDFEWLTQVHVGVTYAGGSCVMSLNPPRPVLHDYLEQDETNVLIVEVDVGQPQ